MGSTAGTDCTGLNNIPIINCTSDHFEREDLARSLRYSNYLHIIIKYVNGNFLYSEWVIKVPISFTPLLCSLRFLFASA